MRLETTRKTHLALQALRVLDTTQAPIKGKDLAVLIDTTPSFIAQIMKPLVDADWVISDRGPTGGYRLAVDLAPISVLSLIEAVEGPTVDGKCVLQGIPCTEADQCPMHEAWVRGRAALLIELAKTPVLQATTQERTAS